MKNCVYKFINADEEIIYIGKAKSLESRLNSHRNNPHLDENVYKEVKRIEYITYPTYMDAGIMERVFISYYQPKYNTEFTQEGEQTIVNTSQIESADWKLYCYYPNGFSLQDKKRKRMGALDKADFILFDGEGVYATIYFYKIIKQNNKPKVLKIIGCLVYYFEDSIDSEFLEEYIQDKREEISQWTKYPMKLIRECDWAKRKEHYNLELKIPIIYKGYTEFCLGEERIPFNYYTGDKDDWEWNISKLVILGALDILTKDGLVDEYDIIGKTITFSEDYSNINLSKILRSNKRTKL